MNLVDSFSEPSSAQWATLRPVRHVEQRREQFDRFCAVALAVAQWKGQCTVVTDELHLVTDAGDAPPHWLELVQTGRGFGVHLLAGSIRPQSIDMDFRTNMTYLRAGRLNEEADCRRVATALMIDWREIAQLPQLEYFERDLLAGTPAQRGKIEF